MAENNNKEYKPISFDAIKIGLASPERIREWSTRNGRPDFGVVTKPETINYRTLKPETDGLFCEKIFGPSKDWECHCGKYRKVRYKGIICDKCNVEVTRANVRRERMGRIELSAPVTHVWYLKGTPSRIAMILDIPTKDLEKVIYFAAYIVLDNGTTDLNVKQVLSEREYQRALEEFGAGSFRVGMGAEAIEELLKAADLEAELVMLKEAFEKDKKTATKRAKVTKRLEVVDAFIKSGQKPEWMVMNTIPVIPPDLRPMVQLEGGRFAASDLNDLYRRIINRNNRLKKLMEMGAPDIIVRNEKRMLQEAVDALIDNGRRGKQVTGPGNRSLKSLTDMLKGKGGRFRQNLLGKRVDYSGRSVIVVGPELKIYQCGLPKEMALELFKPFVLKELTAEKNGVKICQNIKAAKKMVERQEDKVWDVLEKVIQEHPVMLNRAPTLHRLGIQAFEPILVEGRAIRLHPLVCTAFNADFDGDQMAVHLPLSVEAQAECRFLLLSPNNLLKPSDGAPVAVPSQDMVLGIYYLTQVRLGTKGEGKYFKDTNEALLAYENQELDLHARINVRRTYRYADGSEVSGVITSTLGRLLFNEVLPQDLGIVKRETEEDLLIPEIDGYVITEKVEKKVGNKTEKVTQVQCYEDGKPKLQVIGKKQLKSILEKVINTHGATKTAEVLDDVKAMGYKYSTRAAMTVSVSDMVVPEKKAALLEDAQNKVDMIKFAYQRGRMTDGERHKTIIKVWEKTTDLVSQALMSNLGEYNNIRMMADSGARGSEAQMKQLAGMRGLMASTTTEFELPIKSNFREGLDVLEYFMSAHGARKALSDTALRTADSGYLTRRMVDVSQELIIREIDCCAGKDFIPGMEVQALMDDSEKGKKREVESLSKRIKGRYAAEDVYDEKGELIVGANHMINQKRLAKIEAAGIEHVRIRTVMTCKLKNGICAKCYGANMATGEPVQVGEAVGIIAAQSIGEPGTQLTMRTFHTGGVAGKDITMGLPRVEELFEARNPKGVAIMAKAAGEVKAIVEDRKKREITILSDGKEEVYKIPYGPNIMVREGDTVEVGQQLSEGPSNPSELLKYRGIEAVENYLIREVQKVYNAQGVDLADKHIEIIVHQMLRRQVVTEAGDSEYLPDDYVDRLKVEEINEQLIAEGKEPMQVQDIILGIAKAAMNSDSFLSAASFQETTKALTDAAIKGKTDPLIGLKENVIIGKLIPAGTGIRRYRDVRLDVDEKKIGDVMDFGGDDTAADDGVTPDPVPALVVADTNDTNE